MSDWDSKMFHWTNMDEKSRQFRLFFHPIAMIAQRQSELLSESWSAESFNKMIPYIAYVQA